MDYLIDFLMFESINKYEFIKKSDNSWEFSDGNNNFLVEFIKNDDMWELIWYVIKNGKNTYDIVNSNIYRILSTIFKGILIEFIENTPECNNILIKGLSKSLEKSETTQRTKIYYRYLTNNPINGWTLDKYQNEIYLDKK